MSDYLIFGFAILSSSPMIIGIDYKPLTRLAISY